MADLAQRLVVPKNIDAERALLTVILLDTNILYNLKIKVDYFYKPEHKAVWQAISRLFLESKPIDLLSLKEELRVANKLDEIGGDDFLNSLNSDEFVPDKAEYYFQLLKDAHTLRTIIDVGTVCIDTGYNPVIRAGAAKEKVLSMFQNFQNDDDVGKTYTLNDLVQKEWDDLHYRIENPDKIGIMTGFTGYDLLSAGLHAQDMIIVAARPGVGKTAFVLKMLLNMAKSGVGSYIWEFEMGRSQMVQRLASIESGVSLTKIANGSINQAEYNKVTEGLRRLQNLPIYLETDVSANIYGILASTRKMVNKHGIKVVALDHIQLVPSGTDDQTQEIGNISRQLKKLAMELDITALIVSQLNRGLEKRQDRRPTLPDLRQSGNLEENADQVVFLYREDYYDKKEDNLGVTELIIGKHRNGPVGTIPLLFKAETADYVEFGGNK